MTAADTPKPIASPVIPASPAVTLDNCDREPIHIPGLIQPHGALLAFDAQGVVTHVSANAPALLGHAVPAPGDTLSSLHFDGHAEVHALLQEALEGHGTEGGDSGGTAEVRLGGRRFDLIVHGYAGVVIAEFEQRPVASDEVAGFALKAHRAMDKLKRQNSIDALLVMAVGAVRQLTGFDRVMAYRFRHDDSGDVVAEDRHEALEPFIGRRYPASDIPAQARRLYVINTLRLIADVQAVPVDVIAANAALLPLDMSHAVLRSVSPIHIEYLRNMGVGASMSISIVVNGRLWGMLACHHRTPLQVTYSARMACDVLAQVLAANVQSLQARALAQRAADAAQLRARLIEGALHDDDPVPTLVAMSAALGEAFEADAVVVAQEAKLHVHGTLPRDIGMRLAQWLASRTDRRDAVLVMNSLSDLPSDLVAACGIWCGLLALRFDDAAHGWLVLARKEQIETIRWGGKPDKEYTSGPLGPRLTPRGSFDVWKEVVSGTAVPWTAPQVEFARQLRDELARAGAARIAEVHRARTQLLAMLGHDLRDPLQSISMAARVLEHGGSENGNRLGQRIQSSSTRMSRLIGQVLDAARLQTHAGLTMDRVDTELVRLLDDLLDEVRVAYPGVIVRHDAPASLHALVDGDRIAQLFSNLVSNARHHGQTGLPIDLKLSVDADTVCFEVRNTAEPIAADLLPNLYSAFKRQATTNVRNKTGLGLGLHIAQAIAVGHDGTLVYSHEDGQVVFRACFPQRVVLSGD
ncbi:ATP-binding protein [Variovorax ginsengisoli]|uniref:histidine kinase n=1 Tax=Variovorax ginsengisoli TaxID=363844 RepID=A0ABT9S8C1_9BURK|nr:ATP-binding protein [Variovorax ginsengisoli]MDP9900597.1 light-regulated signal transduction histidine kinase (bacteriophytochrome) [Variovorax ginsengisoli]